MILPRLESDPAGMPEPNPKVPSRLLSAAHQFEAMMMKELLAPMSQVSLSDGDDRGGGVLGEFASESLAGALSSGGGLGIANRIMHELAHSHSSGGPSNAVKPEHMSTDK
jgi:Rod binding domain-containing protein